MRRKPLGVWASGKRRQSTPVKDCLETHVGSGVKREVCFEGQECRTGTDGRKGSVADLGQGGGKDDIRIGTMEKVCGGLRYVKLAYSLMCIAATCAQISGMGERGRAKIKQLRYS